VLLLLLPPSVSVSVSPPEDDPPEELPPELLEPSPLLVPSVSSAPVEVVPSVSVSLATPVVGSTPLTMP